MRKRWWRGGVVISDPCRRSMEVGVDAEASPACSKGTRHKAKNHLNPTESQGDIFTS